MQLAEQGPRGSGCLPPGGAAGLISSLALMADSVDVKGGPEIARVSGRGHAPDPPSRPSEGPRVRACCPPPSAPV